MDLKNHCSPQNTFWSIVLSANQTEQWRPSSRDPRNLWDSHKRWHWYKSNEELLTIGNTLMKCKFTWSMLPTETGQSPALKTQLDQVLSNPVWSQNWPSCEQEVGWETSWGPFPAVLPLILIWRLGFSSQVETSKVRHLVHAMEKRDIPPYFKEGWKNLPWGGTPLSSFTKKNTTCLDSDN